jgi:hypothetical protein
MSQDSREKVITENIFRTAYKVAKENHSFNNFESETDLQKLDAIDMGRILHSTNACINIVNHIGQEVRKKLFKKILKSNSKISLIINESTMLSKESTLIVYIRIFLTDKGLNSPVYFFFKI